MRREVTVADCERVQTKWFVTRAQMLSGEVRVDDGLTWTRGPDGVNLMFPHELSASTLDRGISWAKEHGAHSIGVWLNLRIDPAPLAAAGFERGWSPWWMVARLSEMAGVPDSRVELQQWPRDDDYSGEHADYADQLALIRDEPRHTWYAAAYAQSGERFAGRSWSHLVLGEKGSLAGVFDMAVWPPFRRQGLGSGLLHAVCAAAANAGAHHAVLNATPEGKLLYEACGFEQIGEGITWWLHLNPCDR